MPRTCALCGHPDRDELENLVMLDDQPFRVVANRADVSTSAVQRHMDHTRPAWRTELASRGIQVRVGDFAHRLTVLLSETESVRDHASDAADDRLMLQAVASEVTVLTALTTKLGIDSEAVGDALIQMDALCTALVVGLVGHPEALRDVVTELRRSGELELAAELHQAVDKRTNTVNRLEIQA